MKSHQESGNARTTSKHSENNLRDKDKCPLSDSSCLINPMRETRLEDEGKKIGLTLAFNRRENKRKKILYSLGILKERKKTPTKICFFLHTIIFSSWIRFLIKAVSDYKKTNKPWFLWVHIELHLCREGRKAFDQSKSKIKLKVNQKLGKRKVALGPQFFQLRSEGEGWRCWG